MAEGDEPNPVGPSFEDVGADAPLLREIQRVLLSSTGPVNWELARQIGIASASWGGEDPAPTEDDRRTFEEVVRLAELKVQAFTGLEPPHDLPRVDPVRRGQWVQANIDGLKAVVEPAASKLAEAVERAQGEGALAETAGFAQQMVRQLSPLLLGAQVGSVLGYLAQHVLGQYDIALPRSDTPALLFVVPNIAAFERDWSLPPTDFRTWVALHEVTHRFEFARPWALGRFRSLLEDFLSTVELDITGLQTRLESLDMSDPQAMQDMLQGEEGLFGAVLDQEQRLKLGRIQAFMASAEGYGDHVTHAMGRELLSSYGRIEEAMRRYRETEQGDPVFERLLGIEMKREQYRLGRAFCDTVAELSDEATLARMWDSPESLPSLPELAEPRLWLARTV
ncbi:MAG TPA: zinc-dependent metalloprotease [Actinomycetota bacterium]|jgi:putative hydrolase